MVKSQAVGRENFTTKIPRATGTPPDLFHGPQTGQYPESEKPQNDTLFYLTLRLTSPERSNVRLSALCSQRKLL